MIRKIIVKNLYGNIHVVKIQQNPYISVIYGSNGVGKTMFLKLIYYLNNNRLDLARKIQFDKVKFKINENYLVYENNYGEITKHVKDTKLSEVDQCIEITTLYYSPDFIPYIKPEFFNKSKERISEFKDYINKKIMFKKIYSFDPFQFMTDNGIILQFDHLSLGEKHFILIYYHLIILSDKNSLILIDEPEFSLHITLQENIINDFLEINKHLDLNSQLILSTHSPSIIANYFDETVYFESLPIDHASQIKLIKEISNDFRIGKISRKDLLYYFLILGEESDYENIRAKAIKKAYKFIEINKEFYHFLEQLLLADESSRVRLLCAKIILVEFQIIGKDVIEWIIKNESESFLIKIVKFLRQHPLTEIIFLINKINIELDSRQCY